MTRPQPMSEQTQDVVTALRVQVDALAAELERLRDDNARLKAQVTSLLTTLTQDEFPDPAILHADCRARLASAERALRPARAMVAMHPKTHKERHWWQYAPCHHLLFVELRAALERLDETTPQKETAS